MSSTHNKPPSPQEHKDTGKPLDDNDKHHGAFVSNEGLEDDEYMFEKMKKLRLQTGSSSTSISDSSTASRVTGPKGGRTSTSEVKKGEFSEKDTKPVLAAANSCASPSVPKRDTNDNRGQSGRKRGPPGPLEQKHTKRSKRGERRNRSENEQEGEREAEKK